MKSIFCEAYQMKNGHPHVCTLMADHKGDHECLCGSWTQETLNRLPPPPIAHAVSEKQ